MLAHVLEATSDGAAGASPREGTLRCSEDFDDVRAAYEAGATVWIDLDQKSAEAEAFLTETFHLHPLVIEDIWSDRSHPKVEEWDSYLYIIVHGVSTCGHDGLDVELAEIDLVVSERFVVTHSKGTRTVAAVRQDLARSPRLLKKGTIWLAHALLDHLVDLYQPVLDDFDDQVNALEDDVVAKAGTHEGPAVMTRIFKMKRSVQRIRRISLHQRDILMRLARGEFDLISPEVQPFFRDVLDHFVRVTDLTDSYREILMAALEAFLSVQSNRMNEVMKALTVMSTIMLPLTFIAGVYGMNFDYIPELHWRYGYAFALALMAGVAGAIILFFRRKRWL